MLPCGSRLQGGRLVSGIETDSSGAVTALVSRDAASGAEERHEADAVVFAISIAGKRCAALRCMLRCAALMRCAVLCCAALDCAVCCAMLCCAAATPPGSPAT